MLISTKKQEINRMLEKMAEVLDISPTQYEDAVKKYEAIATYLGNDEKINQYKPEMYPQGSFNLGTIIKPETDDDEYDIDLVCELKLCDTKSLTQEQLKNLVGDRLKSGMYKSMLKDLDGGRRCWTIDYAESTKLHLDILPVIPDNNSRIFLESSGVNHGNTAVNLTDKENRYYKILSDDWVKSNPKGYLAWFKEQMLISLNESRKMFSATYKTKIEDVPDYKVKTPLQRAIQLLKRHRDTTYGSHEDKPISIIITTLAAHAYKNEDNLVDALTSILTNMKNYISYEYRNGKRVAIIKNPVDFRENFADKWEIFPNREKVFFEWLDKAQDYFGGLLNTETNREMITESLNSGFGDKMTRKMFSALGDETRMNREMGLLRMETATGILGVNIPVSDSKKVPDHNFHGNEK